MDRVFKATKQEMLESLDRCMSTYRVAALTNKDGRPMYDFVTSSKQVILEYRPTVLPPKKFFFPPTETILEYSKDGKMKTVIEAEPLVLFGVRPCDINGIKILTEAFADVNGDPNYLSRRENAIVIGIECAKKCDNDDAFCTKVNAHKVTTGHDILLADLGDDYLIKEATDKGTAFINEFLKVNKVDAKEFDDFIKRKEAAFAQEDSAFKDLERLPEIFSKSNEHPIWNQEGERCLSCGSCVMVCPTCYCFDVKDQWDLNLKDGKRVRQWDGCMLCDFAVVAAGENFRNTKEARLKHRMNRKFNYLMKKHGQAVCVGCGRCVRACLVDISPKTVVEALNGEA